MSIIIKVKISYFEWCIVCLSKMSLDKATRQRSELLDDPTIIGPSRSPEKLQIIGLLIVELLSEQI